MSAGLSQGPPVSRAGPHDSRSTHSRLEQDSEYEDTTRSYKCQTLALEREQRGSERRRVMRVDRKAGGRCIVRVNKSSVSGQPHASASPSSPSSGKKTRWEAVQAPSVTCKSNDGIDGVDGSSALSSAALVPAPDYRRGGRTGAEAPQIRRSRMDLSRESRATATHAATNRREARWRQSGKSKVLDCHQGDRPFSLFLGLYRTRVRFSVADLPVWESHRNCNGGAMLEAPALPAFPSMLARNIDFRYAHFDAP